MSQAATAIGRLLGWLAAAAGAADTLSRAIAAARRLLEELRSLREVLAQAL